MARGLKTGGRKAGTPNKATIERELRAARGMKMAYAEGLLPLDVMLARMRNEDLPNGQRPTDEQFQAAVAAAPFLHPKLAATTLKGDPNAPLLNEGPRYDLSLLEVEELATLRRLSAKAECTAGR